MISLVLIIIRGVALSFAIVLGSYIIGYFFGRGFLASVRDVVTSISASVAAETKDPDHGQEGGHGL